jgi:hypothetical protein
MWLGLIDFMRGVVVVVVVVGAFVGVTGLAWLLQELLDAGAVKRHKKGPRYFSFW